MGLDSRPKGRKYAAVIVATALLVLAGIGSGAAYASDAKPSTPDPDSTVATAPVTDPADKADTPDATDKVDEGKTEPDAKPTKEASAPSEANAPDSTDKTDEGKTDPAGDVDDSKTNLDAKPTEEVSAPSKTDASDQVSAPKPVASTNPSEEAPIVKSPEPAEWIPRTVITLSQIPCGQDEKSNVAFDYSKVAPGETPVDSILLNGEPQRGDASLLLPPGTYSYAYNVLNLATGEKKLVTSPTPLIIKECTVPPVDCQSNLDGRTGTYSHTNTMSTYTVSIPKPACADLKAGFGDTYTLPGDYDGSGSFNGSASPRPFVPDARAELIIPEGKTSVTVTKPFTSALKCGVNWLLGSTYGGPQQDVVTYPQGSNAYLAGGVFRVDGPSCVTLIAVPGMPSTIDKCGPDNIAWVLPIDVRKGVLATVEKDGSVTLKPDTEAGYQFEAEQQSVNYPLPADSNKPCPVTPTPTPEPITPTVTPTPEPTTPAVTTRSDSTPGPTSAKLAVTGGNDSGIGEIASGALALLAVGAVILGIRRRRSHQSS